MTKQEKKAANFINSVALLLSYRGYKRLQNFHES